MRVVLSRAGQCPFHGRPAGLLQNPRRRPAPAARAAAPQLRGPGAGEHPAPAHLGPSGRRVEPLRPHPTPPGVGPAPCTEHTQDSQCSHVRPLGCRLRRWEHLLGKRQLQRSCREGAPGSRLPPGLTGAAAQSSEWAPHRGSRLRDSSSLRTLVRLPHRPHGSGDVCQSGHGAFCSASRLGGPRNRSTPALLSGEELGVNDRQPVPAVFSPASLLLWFPHTSRGRHRPRPPAPATNSLGAGVRPAASSRSPVHPPTCPLTHHPPTHPPTHPVTPPPARQSPSTQ